MEYKDMWLTNNRPRRKLTPLGVCIHWTANTKAGSNAIANRNYFENHPKAQVSAHYVVDDKHIVRCIPEDEVAWHAGGTKYTDLAKTKFKSKPNDYLIGIEMCVNSDGNWEETYQNTVFLVADIIKRHNWTTEDIYRHYDITGKDCPRMMTPYVEGGQEYFEQFKRDVQRRLADMALQNWEKELGENALAFLNKKGLIHNPKDWNEKLGENVPNWLLFTMMQRLLEYTEKK